MDPPGKLACKACGIRTQEAVSEIAVQVPDLVFQHPAAVIQALFRPPEHHPGPLDEGREQQGAQQPRDALCDAGESS